jgi:polysaccharide biosynthesis transport protein
LNPNQPSSTGFALGPREVLLILFRNKWKIIFCTLLGLGAAAYFYTKMEPPYESTAKLLVKYVVDSAAVTPQGSDGYAVRNVDSQGANVLNVEVEILTSWDLALEVAQAIGPTNILGSAEATNLVSAAAGRILSHLRVAIPPRSSVISVGYRHSQPEMAVRVLDEVVNQYRARHLEAHRSSGSHEALQRETDTMRLRLRETQQELSQLKNRLGITSLAEAKTEISTQMRTLESSIIAAQADLAQRQARLDALRNTSVTNSPVLANADALVPLPSPVPEAVSEKYRLLSSRLSHFRTRELELSQQFNSANALVKQVQMDIAAAELEKRDLERDHPGLLLLPTTASPAGVAQSRHGPDISLEAAELMGTRARLGSFTNELAALRARLETIHEAENQIMDLDRRLAQEEKAYTTSESNLQRARFDEALDPSKIPNINIVQRPSAPVQDQRERRKFAGIAAFLGLALGLGLAFLRELVFDQSIRTPMEIETRLQLPMFMSIPLLSDRQPVRLLANGSGKGMKGKGDEAALARPERAPWEVSHFIRPYSDALRDRLIMYFQLKNIHHKPKLVAVTSCSEGAGTTTLAASLAASLSETGDGKVLLVDMNVSRPEMHPFFRGNLASSLTELFQPGAAPAHGQYDNLYLATGTERNGEVSPLVPSKFYEMLPRMRSSDFDYIIFDMPAVKQTSATVALSGFMDKVLLLIEPGKTNRDAVKRATELMRQQHADVAGVVNRLPASAMKWLQPEIA